MWPQLQTSKWDYIGNYIFVQYSNYTYATEQMEVKTKEILGGDHKTW